jgi:hypothetical protein
MAEAFVNDYRAGFPSACLLFPDVAQTLATRRASGLKIGRLSRWLTAACLPAAAAGDRRRGKNELVRYGDERRSRLSGNAVSQTSTCRFT